MEPINNGMINRYLEETNLDHDELPLNQEEKRICTIMLLG